MWLYQVHNVRTIRIPEVGKRERGRKKIWRKNGLKFPKLHGIPESTNQRISVNYMMQPNKSKSKHIIMMHQKTKVKENSKGKQLVRYKGFLIKFKQISMEAKREWLIYLNYIKNTINQKFYIGKNYISKVKEKLW